MICAELGCFAASSCNIGKHGFLSNDELRLVRGSENGHGCDKFKLILVNLQVQTPRWATTCYTTQNWWSKYLYPIKYRALFPSWIICFYHFHQQTQPCYHHGGSGPGKVFPPGLSPSSDRIFKSSRPRFTSATCWFVSSSGFLLVRETPKGHIHKK